MEKAIERLEFDYVGRERGEARPPALAGVVASGNLEVMIESASLGGGCRVEVNTSARGFGEIWRAVLDDFFTRHDLGDLRITVNDAGATPAVVSLRLDQALEDYRDEAT